MSNSTEWALFAMHIFCFPCVMAAQQSWQHQKFVNVDCVGDGICRPSVSTWVCQHFGGTLPADIAVLSKSSLKAIEGSLMPELIRDTSRLKVLKLLHRRERWLVVAAIRFIRTCIAQKDEFYNRHLVTPTTSPSAVLLPPPLFTGHIISYSNCQCMKYLQSQPVCTTCHFRLPNAFPAQGHPI